MQRVQLSGAQRAFESFIQGGFECSSHLWPSGLQLDLSASTGHAYHPRNDFLALARCGIKTVRDGLCWPLIEQSPGWFNWQTARPLIRAARACNVDVVWDLCHYGYPRSIDLWSPTFPDRFAEFAREAAGIVKFESGGSGSYCPINEISYWAWAGGEMGHFGPCEKGRGAELKRQLVRASIAAIKAIRGADPQARIVSAEPAIHVAALTQSDLQQADAHHHSQYEACDMLMGQTAPELGGDPSMPDIIGINFYPHNQWYWAGAQIQRGSPDFRPLRTILEDIHRRYARPILISETGTEGVERVPWFEYVCDEVLAAIHKGVPVTGICIYPVTDYPGWGDERHCKTGLLGYPDGQGERAVYAPLAAAVARQNERFLAYFRKVAFT